MMVLYGGSVVIVVIVVALVVAWYSSRIYCRVFITVALQSGDIGAIVL